MADGVAYAVHSFPPPSNGEKPDTESAALMPSQQLRKKKRIKCVLFGTAFAVFQTAIILVFVLLIMKYKAPKFRLRSATFDNFNVVASPSSNASFDARFNAQLGVKNSNFGPYKYRESKVEFFYGDLVVGEAVVPGSKAGLKSTKKVEVAVRVSSENVTDVKQLGSELSSGMLRLNVRSKLEGKVTLIFVMKKKKTSELDCILTIHLDKKTFQDITCK
nr:late embryogenesis abundant protein At1g64065-like [Ipomoea batatas]